MAHNNVEIHTISSSDSESDVSADNKPGSKSLANLNTFTKLINYEAKNKAEASRSDVNAISSVQMDSCSDDSNSSNCVLIMEKKDQQNSREKIKKNFSLNLSLRSRLTTLECKTELNSDDDDEELPDLDSALSLPNSNGDDVPRTNHSPLKSVNIVETVLSSDDDLSDINPQIVSQMGKNAPSCSNMHFEHRNKSQLAELSDDNELQLRVETTSILPGNNRPVVKNRLEEAHAKVTQIYRKENCLKSIKVVIDENIIMNCEGNRKSEIVDKLDTNEYNYEICKQVMENSISWLRKLPNCLNSQTDNYEWIAEDQIMVILPMHDFVPMINNYKKQCQNANCADGVTLKSFSECVQASYPSTKMTFVICESQQYFKKQKAKQSREFKKNAMGLEPSQSKRKKKDPLIEVSKFDMEEVIVDMHLNRTNCDLHFINSMTELPSLLAYFTKSIAVAPFKRDDHKGDFSWYLEGDNKKSVRVDRSGKFLNDLWRLQIQCFVNVGSNAADAIVAEYPTPQSLLKAYHKSSSYLSAQLLLQDISVRRQAGPLSTTRRIGPELSKKIHAFFTSTDGHKILHKL